MSPCAYRPCRQGSRVRNSATQLPRVFRPCCVVAVRAGAAKPGRRLRHRQRLHPSRGAQQHRYPFAPEAGSGGQSAWRARGETGSIYGRRVLHTTGQWCRGPGLRWLSRWARTGRSVRRATWRGLACDTPMGYRGSPASWRHLDGSASSMQRGAEGGVAAVDCDAAVDCGGVCDCATAAVTSLREREEGSARGKHGARDTGRG
jgi:hypothetical protein